jgi:DNA-binding CsgD family transcriptional regulator
MSDLLLGRDVERAQIDAFWAGDATTLCLTGEAGIGKTVLWAAALDSVRCRGWRVLRAVPAEAECDLPYAVLGDLFGPALDDRSLTLPLPQRRALEVALLRRPANGARADPRGVALATTSVLGAVAAAGPTVVAVDDWQWADRSSADALLFALRRVPTARALLTVRTGEPGTRGLDPGRDAVVLHLGPLTEADTSRLLLSALGSQASPMVARRLHGAARGNPLHALELGRSLRRRWPWTADSVVPPAELADLVRERVAQLPDDARDLLLWVSAMSRPTTSLLARARGDVDEPLRRCVEAGLLRNDGDRLWFTHPLYATICYRQAAPAQRARVHARLAEVVTDPERHGRHRAHATSGPDAGVAADLDLAARHAHGRGAPHTAAELAELARTLTPPGDGAAQARRTRTVAQYLLEAGEPASARRTLERLLAEQPHGPDRARTLIALALVVYEDEGVAAMRTTVHEALDEARGDPDATAEAQLTLSWAQLPAVEAVQYAEAALARFEELDEAGTADPGLLADALRQVATARWQLGRGVSPELTTRATELEALGDRRPPVAWRARACYAECVKYLDGFAEADELLAECEELAEREGDLSSIPDLAGHRSELALWLGRWPEALAHAERALETATLSEQGGRIGFSRYFRAQVDAHRGDLARACADAAAVIDDGLAADDPWRVALARGTLGFVALSCGDPLTARRELGDVDDFFSASPVLAEPRQWRYLGDYVEALVRSGDLDAAADRLDRMTTWATGLGTPSALAALDRATGMLFDGRGDLARALEHLAGAASAYARLPLPFEQARTGLRLGSALRRARRRREARTVLAQALEGFQALGAPRWCEQVEVELGRLGGRAASAGTLTTSETRVAELVARGLSNKEVAAVLVVTPRTVEAHLTRIYAKLGVRSRVELARAFG